MAFLAILAIIQFANQRVTMDRISLDQEEQQKILEEVREENLRLQDEVNKLNSAEYIEQQARERLEMIKANEIPVINDPAATVPQQNNKTDSTTVP